MYCHKMREMNLIFHFSHGIDFYVSINLMTLALMPRPLLILLTLDLLQPADAELNSDNRARDHHNRRDYDAQN